MKEEVKEVKIVAPDGYEIDRAHSTFDKIIFKKKEVERWREKKYTAVSGYFINLGHEIQVAQNYPYGTEFKGGYDIFATEKQVKSALAMARISQIMENDERFGGAITDEEWLKAKHKFTIERKNNKICKECFFGYYQFLAFHTEEQRDLFIFENEDLVKDYLMID